MANKRPCVTQIGLARSDLLPKRARPNMGQYIANRTTCKHALHTYAAPSRFPLPDPLRLMPSGWSKLKNEDFGLGLARKKQWTIFGNPASQPCIHPWLLGWRRPPCYGSRKAASLSLIGSEGTWSLSKGPPVTKLWIYRYPRVPQSHRDCIAPETGWVW